MNENYLDTLSKLSNKELLEIITDKTNSYEKEAIEIAQLIIEQRKISSNETEKLINEINENKASERKSKEKIDNYKKQVKDLFQPIVQHQDDKIEPRKWINSFLVLVAIQLLWYFYEYINFFLSGDGEMISLYSLFLVYFLVLGYLLFKRKRWGWILLFGEKTLLLFLSLIMLVIFLINDFFVGSMLNDFVVIFFMSVVYISFLIKEDIYTYFKIAISEKNKLIKNISVISLMVVGFIITFFMFL